MKTIFGGKTLFLFNNAAHTPIDPNNTGQMKWGTSSGEST